jgi:protein-S-isoprenylcysteine O-methyltransferase Ste14
MNGPTLTLLFLVVGLTLTMGWRDWSHRKATGSSGFRPPKQPWTAAWFGSLLLGISLLLGLLSPVLVLTGVAHTWWELGTPGLVVGSAVTLSGLLGILWSQGAMGNSWRIGVQEDERTQLVSGGPFRIVRNPIYIAIATFGVGLFLLTPGALGMVAVAGLVAAIQIEVRLVEEPYLRRMHGDAYVEYCRQVGRFVPWLGRLRE